MVVTLRPMSIDSPSRRRFLESAVAVPIAAALGPPGAPAQVHPEPQAPVAAAVPPPPPAPRGPAAAGRPAPTPAVLISMLPAGTYAERFAIAKTAGFTAIEM